MQNSKWTQDQKLKMTESAKMLINNVKSYQDVPNLYDEQLKQCKLLLETHLVHGDEILDQMEGESETMLILGSDYRKMIPFGDVKNDDDDDDSIDLEMNDEESQGLI